MLWREFPKCWAVFKKLLRRLPHYKSELVLINLQTSCPFTSGDKVLIDGFFTSHFLPIFRLLLIVCKRTSLSRPLKIEKQAINNLGWKMMVLKVHSSILITRLMNSKIDAIHSLGYPLFIWLTSKFKKLIGCHSKSFDKKKRIECHLLQ